jgi:3-phenylpropionate/trans-cinnamate dioxygenase ferredoxin reductase subunit
MADLRAPALGAAAGAVVALPLSLALTDRHFADASTALALSIVAGTLAASALAIQPLLARGRRIARHQLLGAVVLGLVLVHVGALFAESSSDAWFALSPDGPTRARMALIATLALFAVVALGALRTRLPLAPGTWRLLHGYLAVVVIALGIGHAVLTDGALDDAGTPVLLGLGVIGLLGVPAAHVVRTRRARQRRPSSP